MAERQENAAQFYDRFLKFVALGSFVLALPYGVGAIRHFVSPEMKEYLEIAKMVFAVSGAAIVFPYFVKFMRLKKKCVGNYEAQSGFIMEVYRKATEYAFSSTFILLIFMEPVAGEFLTDVPAVLYVHFALTVALLTLSGSFFFMSRGDDDLDDEFDEGVA